MSDEHLTSSGESFPAPVYAETVLAVNFNDARRYFLDSLLQLHAAHTLMLESVGLLTAAQSRACLGALAKIDRAALDRARYDGRFKDLYFFVQSEIDRVAGADVAGNMHLARSRNDIDLTLYRMGLRREILRLIGAMVAGRTVLIEKAREHADSLMPAYTHTQPAQPTTMGHYLMAAVDFTARDIERLQSAFRVVNLSPLGACAITTTGFPIDRPLTAELLGFEGLVENSYDAIASIDYVTGTAGALATAMISLGRLVQDLLLWSTEEYGFLRLSRGYVQISSIMPQKRNPVALEHIRILASKAVGHAQAILTAVHNTPFGDINDNEDDLQPLVLSAFRDAVRAWRLFGAVMAEIRIDRGRLRERAAAGLMTVTELADTLVRREGITFPSAHRLVTRAIESAGGDRTRKRVAAELARLAPEYLGREPRSTEKEWLDALDPEYFVKIRRVIGGPAPDEVGRQIERARKEAEASQIWLDDKLAILARYPERLQEAAHERGIE